MTSDSLSSLVRKINAFADVREWSQFHDPKNVSMALASEVGELCAMFRWVDQHDADAYASAHKDGVTEEIGDLGILLLRLCDRLNIDFADAIEEKLAVNELKYPPDQSRGRAERPPN